MDVRNSRRPSRLQTNRKSHGSVRNARELPMPNVIAVSSNTQQQQQQSGQYHNQQHRQSQQQQQENHPQSQTQQCSQSQAQQHQFYQRSQAQQQHGWHQQQQHGSHQQQQHGSHQHQQHGSHQQQQHKSHQQQQHDSHQQQHGSHQQQQHKSHQQQQHDSQQQQHHGSHQQQQHGLHQQQQHGSHQQQQHGSHQQQQHGSHQQQQHGSHQQQQHGSHQQQHGSHQQQHPLQDLRQTQDSNKGQSRIPAFTRRRTSDSHQTVESKATKHPQPPAIPTDNNAIDTPPGTDVLESFDVECVQMQGEKQAQISSSQHHQNLGPMEQTDESTRPCQRRGQNTSNKNEQQQVTPALQVFSSNATDIKKNESAAPGSTTEVSRGSRPPRRSRSSNAQGRRRSYHDNRGGAWMNLSPFQHQQWLENLRRYHRGEDANVFIPPSFNPVILNHKEHSVPPRSFKNWRNCSTGRSAPPHSVSQSTRTYFQASEMSPSFDMSGSSIPEACIWLNGHQMEGSHHGPTPKHCWRLSSDNQHVGVNHMSHCNIDHHQEPKQKSPEAPLVRHRKNAIQSPECVPSAYPRNKNEILDFERVRLEQDTMPSHEYLLFENHNRNSRHDQFLFSAHVPPPPISNSNIKQQQPTAQSIADTELPRHIGHVLNDRGKPVDNFRCHQGHSCGSPKKGNGSRGYSNSGLSVPTINLKPQPDNVEHEGRYINSESVPLSDNQIYQSTRCRQPDKNSASSYDNHIKSMNKANREAYKINPPKSTYNDNGLTNWSNTVPSKSQDNPQMKIKHSHSNFSTKSNDDEVNALRASKESIQCGCFEKIHPDLHSSPSSSTKTTAINYSQNRTRKVTGTVVVLSEKLPQHKIFDSSPPKVLNPSPLKILDPSLKFSDPSPLKISDSYSVKILGPSPLKIINPFSHKNVNPSPRRQQVSSVSDAQEDLAKMQQMGLPIKDNNKNLDPGAKDFTTVPVRDGSGNLYTMTSQNGVCFFRPATGSDHVFTDPRYVIKSDRHQLMNGKVTSIVSSQVSYEAVPEKNVFNEAPISVTNNERVESQTYVQNQEQQHNQNFQHTHLNQVNVHSKQGIPSHLVSLVEQPFIPQPLTPFIPLPTPMFAFPQHEMNVPANQLPMAQTVSSDVTAETHFPQVTTQMLLTPHTGSNFISTIANGSDIQSASKEHGVCTALNSGLHYNPFMSRNDPFSLFPFQTDCNGVDPTLLNIPRGNFPFFNQPLGQSYIGSPGMSTAFPAHGQMIYQNTTAVPQDFNHPTPIIHSQHSVDNQFLQVDKSGLVHQSHIVHQSPGLKRVELHDVPNECTHGQAKRSLYEKVKDTLQEVRQSLRPREPTEMSKVDKPMESDSEDSKILSVELSEVASKLAVVYQRGKISNLQTLIANAPEHLRPTMELMLRFLCIFSEENTDLSSASFNKLVTLCRSLASIEPPGAVQNLLDLLPKVGGQKQEGVLNSGLEHLILKSIKEVKTSSEGVLIDNAYNTPKSGSCDPTSTEQPGDQCTHVKQTSPKSRGFDPNSTEKLDKGSDMKQNTPKSSSSNTTSAEQPEIYTHIEKNTPKSNSCASTNTKRPEEKKCINVKQNSSGSDPTTRVQPEDGLAIDANFTCDTYAAVATLNDQNTCSELSATQPLARVELPGQWMVEPDKSRDTMVDLKDKQAYSAPVQTLSNQAEPNGTPPAYKNIGSATAPTEVGLDAEGRFDNNAEHHSQNGTPHPKPRHRSIQRVNGRSSQYADNRSPAFDKVDIASRIGVFERMRSKR